MMGYGCAIALDNGRENITEHMFLYPGTLRVLAIDVSRPAPAVCRLWGDLGDVRLRCETLPLGEGVGRLERLSLWLRDAIASDGPEAVVTLGYDGAEPADVGHCAELCGVIRLVLREAGRDPIAVPANAVSLWACGKAGASRDEIAFAAVRRFGPQIESPDCASSAWLAEIGYYLHTELDGSTPARRHVLWMLRCHSGQAVTAIG